MTLPLVIALVALGTLAVLALHWRLRQRVQAVVRGREPLTDTQFAALFPSQVEGEVGVSIRHLLDGRVAVDVALVRPGDEFSGDLRLDAWDGLESEELMRAVERRWGVSVARSQAEQMRTIAQLAAAVAAGLVPAGGRA